MVALLFLHLRRTATVCERSSQDLLLSIYEFSYLVISQERGIMNSTIGSRIRDRRKELGMSQEELAEKLYTSKQMISSYENDKTEIKVSVLRELVETLNTSTSYLVDGIVEVRHTPQVEQLLGIFSRLDNDKIREIAIQQMKLLLNIG